jgi:hypothetical protein
MCFSDFHGCRQRYASVIKLDKAYAMTDYFGMKYPLNQRQIMPTPTANGIDSGSCAKGQTLEQ